MNKCKIVAIFLVHLGFLIACTSANSENTQNPYRVWLDNEFVYFEGRLSGDAAEDFRSALSSPQARSVKTLRINSTGGLILTANAIARIVHENGLNVEVLDYCASGCASSIFLAGKRKILNQNSSITFHNSGTKTQRVLKHSPLAEAANLFQKSVDDERELYRQLGIDLKLLNISETAMSPVCVREDKSKQKSDAFRYGVGSVYPAWVPSRRVLAKLGVKNIEGPWPESEKTAQKRASKYFNEQFRVNFFDDVSLHPLPVKQYGVCSSQS